jgi:hypothetical protein
MSDKVQWVGPYGRTLNLFLPDANSIGIGISRVEGSTVNDLIAHLPPEEFASAVNELDGFTATYERVVHVPTGIGAIVHSAPDLYYTKVVRDQWIASHTGARRTDANIETLLRTGGGKIISEGVEL